MVLHHVVEALGPPRLIKIQILGLSQVGEGTVEGLVDGHIAGGGHDVVLVGAGLDGGGDLVDHHAGVVVVLLDADDLDAQALLGGLVALKDGVVDGLGDDLLHGDLTRGPALAVAADDGDVGVTVVEAVGEPVGQLGLDLGHGRGGGGGVGLRGVLHVLSAGGKAADQHEKSQEARQDTGQFHSIPPKAKGRDSYP